MEIVRMSIEPRDPTDPHSPEAVEAHVLRIEDEREKRERAKTPWFTWTQIVDEIKAHKNDPTVAIRLLDTDLVRVLVGAMIVLAGGPGSGKSTLASNVLLQHAIEVGPALAVSIELPMREFGARTIGLTHDASWIGALTGEVSDDAMDRFVERIPRAESGLPRYLVLDRKRANLANLKLAVDALKKAWPGLPILVAVDYVQILKNENGPKRVDNERLRVADLIEELDEMAREMGFVVIALSQMSAANSKIARSGEAIGVDGGAELAAETTAFNRFATVGLSIGARSPRCEDGSEVVELSVGKFRMGQGDGVWPMRTWGRSGKWRVDGPFRPAQEVRDSRDAEKAAKKEKKDDNALVGIVARSSRPMTQNEICDEVGGNKSKCIARIKRQIADKTLCYVGRRAPTGRKGAVTWMIWTPEKARSSGIGIVVDGVVIDGSEAS